MHIAQSCNVSGNYELQVREGCVLLIRYFIHVLLQQSYVWVSSMVTYVCECVSMFNDAKYELQVEEGCFMLIQLFVCKGSCHLRFSGIRPLRGGWGYPPFPLRKKTFFFSHWFSVKGGVGVRGGARDTKCNYSLRHIVQQTTYLHELAHSGFKPRPPWWDA